MKKDSFLDDHILVSGIGFGSKKKDKKAAERTRKGIMDGLKK